MTPCPLFTSVLSLWTHGIMSIVHLRLISGLMALCPLFTSVFSLWTHGIVSIVHLRLISVDSRHCVHCSPPSYLCGLMALCPLFTSGLSLWTHGIVSIVHLLRLISVDSWRQPRWLSGLMRSRVHSLWLLVDHCVLRNWDRILVRAVKGLISRAGMVSICPLLWQRDVKLQQASKQAVDSWHCVHCSPPPASGLSLDACHQSYPDGWLPQYSITNERTMRWN